ncbi:hypothetical protein LCGC14_2371370, partial [marine sediment metagenome]
MKRFIILFILFFAVNCFADESINTGGEVSPGIQMWVEEEDGSPSKVIYKLKVTNDAFTDNADGTGSLDLSGTETDTLDTVTGRGSTTTNTIQTGDIALTGSGPDITLTPSGGDAMGIHAESDIFIIKNETDNHQWFRAEGNQSIFLNPDGGNVSIGGGLGFPDKLLYVNGTTQITGATQIDS